MRVAAPTGCAAFNIRFGATTLYRLFQMLRPNKFVELREDSPELAAFQEKMRATRLLIIDEISMVGKHMMGNISFRSRQSKDSKDNPRNDVLGGM